MTDPASATPSLPAPASISLISSIFAAAQFLRHLALYILSCGQLEGRRRGSELGMPASFHHSLGTGISPSTSSTMPPLPTSAVNPWDLDFRALVFHSHCSLWLSFLNNPFDKLRDHCEDAESIRRSSDRSGVAPGTAGHRTVTSHSTVCYTATRGNAAQTQGRADLPALL